MANKAFIFKIHLFSLSNFAAASLQPAATIGKNNQSLNTTKMNLDAHCIGASFKIMLPTRSLRFTCFYSSERTYQC